MLNIAFAILNANGEEKDSGTFGFGDNATQETIAKTLNDALAGQTIVLHSVSYQRDKTMEELATDIRKFREDLQADVQKFKENREAGTITIPG